MGSDEEWGYFIEEDMDYDAIYKDNTTFVDRYLNTKQLKSSTFLKKMNKIYEKLCINKRELLYISTILCILIGIF